MKHTKAREILQACERELRALVAESASNGDYSSVMSLTSLARAVADLSVRTVDGQHESTSHSHLQDNAEGAATGPISMASRVAQPKGNYPEFYRKGDELVKVGWSKRERREYHHRAPRAAVDAISGALKKTGVKGRLFNGGDLMRVIAADDSIVVPDYQVYVVLAWMKDLEVVKQRGRRAGYTFSGGSDVATTVAAAWLKLLEWKG